MKNILFLTMLMVFGLTACSNATKQKLGLAKQAPNEFLVNSRAPLTLPPEYDLRPVEGMNNNQESDDNKLSGMSSGEKKLISNIDVSHSDSDIKNKIDQELEEMKKVEE